MSKRKVVFFDLDGVLADFDRGYEEHFGWPPTGNKQDRLTDAEHQDDVDWSCIPPGFFRSLPVMPGAVEMWRTARALAFNVAVCTGVPRSMPFVRDEKRGWVEEHLGPGVRVFTCLSRDKHLYCEPGDVLVDDRAKCGLPWRKMGGVWIPHDNPGATLRELEVITSSGGFR